MPHQQLQNRQGWEPVPTTEDPKVQFAAYGTPLTVKQFQKLIEKGSPENARKETK